MHDFEIRLDEVIRRHELLWRDAPVIVAISGGADSVALLSALTALGYNCVGAHCNYHLRGEESNRDMRHVQNVCRALGVDLYVKDFDVEKRRRGTGESVEMACRELRYGWFNALLDKLRAQAIAVAHHREDNVETFFLNLMRGSSIAGLTGMRRRNGYVVRPMLDFSRAEIEAYLNSRCISYVTDSTNASCDFARNRLRNIVLPALEQAFPGATCGVLDSIRLLTANRRLYDSAVAERIGRYMTDTEIDLKALMAGEEDPELLLFEILHPLGFNATHVANILRSASSSGLHFVSTHTTLELSRGRLSVAARTDGESDDAYSVDLHREIPAPLHILISEHVVTEFRPVRDPDTAYFDVTMLDGAPDFTLRRWRRGDRMIPFGMTGSRLLSDIFSDAKYTAADKRRAWVLTRDDEIIWVPGLRQSAQWAVCPETKRYLRLWRKK